MKASLFSLLPLLLPAAAQQVYISSNGSSPRPWCTSAVAVTTYAATPTFYHSNFSYTQTETVRTATAVQSTTPAPTYAPAYSAISSLLNNISTTTWGNWDPSAAATTTAPSSNDPYGPAAFSSLWEWAALSSFSRGAYSTTVSPTAVPTSSLILPPPLYFGPTDCLPVPKDFVFGVAGSAAQIEGAVADEGRGPAISERAGQIPIPAFTSGLNDSQLSNNFVATESYYLYKQDIDRLAAIGVKYYSFSISWTRILPFGLPGTPVNAQGIQHYDDLINHILEKGMIPMATIFHWDTPLVLTGLDPMATSDSGYLLGNFNFGAQNSTFREALVNYGKIVMTHYSDRVPIWVTINEPQTGIVTGPSFYNVIMSHADLYHFYHNEINGTGEITIKMAVTPGVPQDPTDPTHVAATEHYNEILLSDYLYPLALGQDYPDAFKYTLQDYIPLSTDDLAYVGGTVDFIGVDVYSIPVIIPVVDDYQACGLNNDTTSNPYWPYCVYPVYETVNGWNVGYDNNDAVYTEPTYLRTALNYLWNTYQVPVMVTELGISLYGPGTTDFVGITSQQYDVERSHYYLSYLTEVLKAIWEDGVNVKGVIMWASADNWEWGSYEFQFGLQYVDRTTSTLDQYYKRSLFDVVDFVESRRLS
ncbi:hypothetical protein BP5796_11990 [Coleophoma crateriformis]|uniref:Glycoside hydrolase family 1 protein n=1 Tax=Coleophoma crateriformis TaxID=565419 RepID=A0A3D8QB52_9HELO|nr:hypothetical protein BP5796_11990 [Coleophoma crateriformis]